MIAIKIEYDFILKSIKHRGGKHYDNANMMIFFRVWMYVELDERSLLQLFIIVMEKGEVIK